MCGIFIYTFEKNIERLLSATPYARTCEYTVKRMLTASKEDRQPQMPTMIET